VLIISPYCEVDNLRVSFISPNCKVDYWHVSFIRPYCEVDNWRVSFISICELVSFWLGGCVPVGPSLPIRNRHQTPECGRYLSSRCGLSWGQWLARTHWLAGFYRVPMLYHQGGRKLSFIYSSRRDTSRCRNLRSSYEVHLWEHLRKAHFWSCLSSWPSSLIWLSVHQFDVNTLSQSCLKVVPIQSLPSCSSYSVKTCCQWSLRFAQRV